MRRILYYCNNTLVLLGWKNGSLVGRVEFEYSESGFKLFKSVMNELPDVPIKLLVNVQEEDFQRESLPHVRGKEKAALVKRLVNRYYRDEPYTHVTFLGRLNEGRKDDKVLLSSLSPSDKLRHWLDLIEQLNLPVAGIWSVPLISHKILPLSPDPCRACIVISKDAERSYRQSLFVDNELILSRKTDAKNQEDLRDSCQLLLSAIDQLYKFSTNKRFVDFKEKVTALCILPDDLYHLLSHQRVADNVEFKRISKNRILENYNSDLEYFPVMDLLYGGICYGEPTWQDNYGTSKDKKNYTRYIANQRFFNLAMVFSALFFASAIVIIINGFFLKKQARFVDTAYNDIEFSYHHQFFPMQKKLDSVDDVQILVDESLNEQVNASGLPTDIFSGLSQILSEKEFSGLFLNKMKWKRYSGAEYETINRLFYQEEVDEYDMSAEGDLDAPQVASEHQSKIFIHLIGEVVAESINYEQTVNVMLYFQGALKSIDGVNDVYMLASPVDLRSQSKFTDAKGIRPINRAGDQRQVFEFVISWDKERLSTPSGMQIPDYFAEDRL